MKAILEFNLPEERDEFEDAANGWKWKDVIWHYLEDYLRPLWKHGSAEWAEEAKSTMYELMDEHGIKLE